MIEAGQEMASPPEQRKYVNLPVVRIFRLPSGISQCVVIGGTVSYQEQKTIAPYMTEDELHCLAQAKDQYRKGEIRTDQRMSVQDQLMATVLKRSGTKAQPGDFSLGRLDDIGIGFLYKDGRLVENPTAPNNGDGYYKEDFTARDKETISTATSQAEVERLLRDKLNGICLVSGGVLGDEAIVLYGQNMQPEDLALACAASTYREKIAGSGQAPQPSVLLQIAGDLAKMETCFTSCFAVETTGGLFNRKTTHTLKSDVFVQNLRTIKSAIGQKVAMRAIF